MVNISKIQDTIKTLELQSKVRAVPSKKIQSLELILEWALKKKTITADEYNRLLQRLNNLKVEKKTVIDKQTYLKRTDILRPVFNQKTLLYIIPMLLLFFVSSLIYAYSIGLNNQAETDVSPSELKLVGKTLRFQGNLIDEEGKPIDKKVDVQLKLYSSERGGKPLYIGKCVGKNALKPSLSGSVAVIIGSDCGMKKIPEELFTKNSNLYLGITVAKAREMRLRFPISSVGHAKNSEKVNGMTLGVDESSIPYIDEEGKLVIGAVSPSIKSTEGDFSLEGETVIIRTGAETAGSIILQPDVGGNVFIDSSKLGIGKDNPDSELDVAGDIGLTGNFYSEGEKTALYQNDGGAIAFYSEEDINDLSKPVLQINGIENRGISVDGNLVFNNTKPHITSTNKKGLSVGDKDTGPIIINSDDKLGLGTDQLVDKITLGGNTVPYKNNIVDLGSPTNRWAKVYTNELLLDNEGIGGYWQRKAGISMPTNIQDDIILGSETIQSSIIKLSGKKDGTSWMANGLLGLGTRSPHYLLSALGRNNNASSVSLANLSTQDSSLTNVVRLQLGVSQNGTNAHFMEFYAGATDDNNGKRVGGIRLNNNGVLFETSGADFAEYMYIKEKPEPGYIVGINGEGKRKGREGDTILGVVSDTAGYVGNAKEGSADKDTLVGLVGQLKTYVSTENGELHTGSLVSIGTTPGYGALAKSNQGLVGVVLDDQQTIENELSSLLCPKEIQNVNGKQIRCGKVTLLLRPSQGVPISNLDKPQKGTETIPAGKTDITVHVNNLALDDQIQITAISKKPVSYSVSEKNVCSKNNQGCEPSFTVTTNKNIKDVIEIQWTIIN